MVTTIPLQQILVPVDFSPRCGEAARYARRLAARFGARVTAMHVLETLRFEYAMTSPSDDVSSAIAEVRRRRAIEKLDYFLGQHDATGARTLVAEGDAAERIVLTAAQENSGLIVMPTRGGSRLREFLIGSVTGKVLHDTTVPVLTGVHLEQRQDFPEFRLRRILCAVDLGPQTACVLRWGAALAAEFGAALTVVHVAPDPNAARGDVADLVAARGAKADVVVAPGEPHKVVTALAADGESDLLVIGRGLATSVAGRLKAQAYAMVRQSPCPVLSV